MSRYWVRPLRAATADAAAVVLWYQQHADSSASSGFVYEFSAAQTPLTTFPGAFRKDSAIGFRRIHLSRYPYVMWYTIDEESHQVLILALTHNR
jgi:plasmid stabilization system protein ParE